jgi:hypothetical protein
MEVNVSPHLGWFAFLDDLPPGQTKFQFRELKLNFFHFLAEVFRKMSHIQKMPARIADCSANGRRLVTCANREIERCWAIVVPATDFPQIIKPLYRELRRSIKDINYDISPCGRIVLKGI